MSANRSIRVTDDRHHEALRCQKMGVGVLGALLLVPLALACGNSPVASNDNNDTTPTTDTTTTVPDTASFAKVTIVYNAPTAKDSAVAAQYPNCYAEVVNTHVHPSWQGYEHVPMIADGSDKWTITFDNVPARAEQNFELNDPNTCGTNAGGNVVDNISVNGVTLTKVVDVNGSPGLAFTVSGTGVVTP